MKVWCAGSLRSYSSNGSPTAMQKARGNYCIIFPANEHDGRII